MKKSRSHGRQVTVVVPYANKAGREFFAGTLRYSRLHGNWRIRVIQSFDEFSAEAVTALTASGTNGIITCGIPNRATAKALERSGLAVVVEDPNCAKMFSEVVRPSSISLDECCIGTCAADYLTGLGNFNSYGFVPCRDSHLVRLSELRGDGFIRRLGQRGIAVSTFRPGDDWQTSLGTWLLGLDRPAAVFTPIDRHGREILDVCERVGLSVPEQIAVLGAADDERYCLTSSPELSSVTTGSEQVGYAAAAELARLMRTTGRAAKPRCRVIKTTNRVSERESTAPLSPATSLINRALEFISANATHNISVADVVHELGCSRRLAEMRFRKLRSESINATIVRTRLECFRRKLHDSKASAASIARACGFANVAYLSTLFKRTFGVTVRQWRQSPTAEFVGASKG